MKTLAANSNVAKFLNAWNAFCRWTERKLSSMYTSVYVLAVMALFFMTGTIFPQGGEYEEYARAGGGFLALVNAFSLLDFFTSPVFLILSIILFLNIAVCAWKRYPLVFQTKKDAGSFAPEHTIELPFTVSDAHEEVKKALKKAGFRIIARNASYAVAEKGLPYRPLTWLYHAGLIACLLGFALTYFFAFEGEMRLKLREAETVMPEETGRLMGLLRGYTPHSDFHLFLDRFMTEYAESPRLEYPSDKLSRLAIGLGWSKNIAYELTENSLSVKDWRAKIKVIKGTRTLTERFVEINEPLKYGGYTFYLMDVVQSFKVRVEDNPLVLETKAGEDLVIPGVDEPLKLGPWRAGTVKRLNNDIEVLKSQVTVMRRGEEVARLSPGGSAFIDGTKITLLDAVEAPVLSYRYDPGVPLLWASGVFVLIIMSLRFFGYWFEAAYNIEERDGRPVLELRIRSAGLMADERRVMERLKYHIFKQAS
ncbi:MAG: cytochrome c biogenesis protein ResB [Deltaproteobacteria bacterium]|nr:cytochrome c biogenesis protein ResB [Deltaproteobacteria bacterium]